MLRARAKPADLLSYDAWEVVVELGSRDDPQPVWKKNAWDEAVFVFTYPLMTGENGMCVLAAAPLVFFCFVFVFRSLIDKLDNRVTWNPVLKRYFLVNATACTRLFSLGCVLTPMFSQTTPSSRAT